MGEQNQMQQAFMAYLADKYQTEDINGLIKQLQSTPGEQGETKLQDEVMEFQKLMQSQQTQAMKNGAQINYLKKLKGGCPEGYEVSYYKSGGHICSKCVAKAQAGAETPSENKQFFTADQVPAAKCGGKTKKKENGGKTEKDCNGKKLSKRCKFGGVLYFNK